MGKNKGKLLVGITISIFKMPHPKFIPLDTNVLYIDTLEIFCW
jgi:hypothetical protein